MSILIKGIDLPTDDNYIVLEIEKSGTVEAYSSTFGEVDGDPIAIQIDRPHGRLIDRDDIYIGRWDIDTDLAEQIQNAPTIIEAEE